MRSVRTITSVVAIAALAVSAAPARAAQLHPNIVGGSRGSIPQLVEITLGPQDSGWLCSGTIVAPNVVMTASHCADVPGPYAVTLPNQRVITVQQVVVEPGFDRSAANVNDAALLVLKGSTSITPVALDPVEPVAGTPALIQGWGKTSATGGAGMAAMPPSRATSRPDHHMPSADRHEQVPD